MGWLKVFWMPEPIAKGKGRLPHCQFIGLGAESYKHAVDTPCDPEREVVACVSGEVSVGTLTSNSTRSP